MDEQQIRQIVQQEIASQSSQNQFRMAPNSRHTHNGYDSPRINAGNILPGLRTTGAVTMANKKDYKFNTNFTPSLIQMYGVVTNISSGYRAIVVGNAALGKNLYFQPAGISAVTIGGKLEIVQSHAQLLYQDASIQTTSSGGNITSVTLTGGVARATTDDQHILNVTDGPTIFARATVSSYGQNFFTVTVETLATGWTINASWFVS